VEHVVIHTGQHYDSEMSDVFFQELGIPEPDINLSVGSGAHGAQTGAMLASLEPAMSEIRPDWVVVYGDTNSTLAASICAVKLHLPLAHIEAGLRSYNRRMPEEHNRVLADHAADLCLAPTQQAMSILSREGLEARSIYVGDVMVDVLMAAVEANENKGSGPHRRSRSHVLATIHRAENTDDAVRLRSIIESLAALPHPVRLPVHPRLASRCREFGIELTQGSVRAEAPLGYRELVSAVQEAAAVVTDSGGLQKEAYVLGVPTSTLRGETEWVETLQGGWNVLVPDPDGLWAAVARPWPTDERDSPFGDGRAAEKVLDALTAARIPVTRS
jgi:UDP-N-acetylglucosamine 2-epimerase (non-hydrolysing)